MRDLSVARIDFSRRRRVEWSGESVRALQCPLTAHLLCLLGQNIFSKQTEIVVGRLTQSGRQKPSNIELLLAGKEQWMINIVI